MKSWKSGPVLLSIFLLISYIILVLIIYHLYRKEIVIEPFTEFLKILSGDAIITPPSPMDNNDRIFEEEDNEQKNKVIYKSISLINRSVDKGNDIIVNYNFLDKDGNMYLVVNGLYNNFEKNLVIKDVNGRELAHINHDKYSDYSFIWNDKRVYFKYYGKLKIQIEGDLNIFYLDGNKIYVFGKEIGKIVEIDNNNKKKREIIVEEDYKKYMNIIGVGYIIQSLLDK
jgi:hypothetical protein